MEQAVNEYHGNVRMRKGVATMRPGRQAKSAVRVTLAFILVFGAFVVSADQEALDDEGTVKKRHRHWLIKPTA